MLTSKPERSLGISRHIDMLSEQKLDSRGSGYPDRQTNSIFRCDTRPHGSRQIAAGESMERIPAQGVESGHGNSLLFPASNMMQNSGAAGL